MIKFGPSGNCKRFYDEGHKSTLDAPKWCADQGLNVYEYSFGRGITLSEKTATEIGAKAQQYDIAVSVHAPYYINFANPSDEMIAKSVGYVVNSVRYVRLMRGNRVVFHTATCGKTERKDAVELASRNLDKMLAALEEN